MNKINTSKFIFMSLLFLANKYVMTSSHAFLCEDLIEQLKSQRQQQKQILIEEIMSCRTFETINVSLSKFYREFPNSINELIETAIDGKNISVIQVLIKHGQKNTVFQILTKKPNVAQFCIEIMSFISESSQ